MSTIPTAVPTNRPSPLLSRYGTVLRHIVMSAVALLMAFPFIAMVMVSIRPRSIIGLRDIFFSGDFTLEFYRYNLRNDSMLQWIFNSTVYACVSVVAVLLLCSMAGYAFAKKRFAGRDVLFWTFLAMLVVPMHVTLIPLFILIVKLHGANTYWGLIVPTIANAQGVFLMRQFIQGIPDELLEAAKLDGASEWRIFWQIVLPLTIPVQATLGVFVFLWHWNDFLWPLIIAQSNNMFTLTVGLATMEGMQPPVGQLMAAAAISFVPTLLVFVVLQRFIVQSIVSSGIKG